MNYKSLQFIFLFYLIINCWLLPKNVSAQTIDSMYYGWVVYEYAENGDDKKCYIAATPYKSDSSFTGLRNPYLAITRYSKTRSEEISLYSGYEYKISSDVYLLIGNVQKQLYTNSDIAWAKSDYDDKDIITLMLQSESVKARSDSSTGNYSVDEYQMKGFNRAYARMKELCR
ncbi:MAG: hypothetical protein V4612_02200 [Pseudomonadota bacterium]